MEPEPEDSIAEAIPPQEEADTATDTAFAAAPKLLTTSPLREGVATFDAPYAVANECRLC